jgi:ABC-type uncharacterized transport system permease subunit
MLANERIFEVVKMAAAVLLALILTFILLLIFSAQPLESFQKCYSLR